MLLNETFYACIAHPGIVSIATASADGKPHIANTWNKYLIVTEEEQILIPCFGFHTTEENALHQPHMELSLGSDQIQGKLGMGTGFLLTGTGKFLSEGALYAQMRAKCDWIKRVLVFSPESCRQTV